MPNNRRRKTDEKLNPFKDQAFGRASVGVTDMGFRRLFDQNIIRHLPLSGTVPVSTQKKTGAQAALESAALAKAESESVVAASVAPPAGTASTPSDYDPAGIIRIVGSNVSIANPAEKSTSSASYVLLKEIRVVNPTNGTMTVYWKHRSGGAGLDVMSQLYVNGVPQGAEKTTNLIVDVEENEVLALNLNAGDLIQVWGKADIGATTIYVSEMRLDYSWGIASLGAYTLDTPLLVTDTTQISTINEDP